MVVLLEDYFVLKTTTNRQSKTLQLVETSSTHFTDGDAHSVDDKNNNIEVPIKTEIQYVQSRLLIHANKPSSPVIVRLPKLNEKTLL